jgi:hypothetical protein
MLYKKLMDINILLLSIITQAILPYLQEQNSGYQRDKQYCAGLIGFPLRSGYAASKHAIKVWKRYNVRGTKPILPFLSYILEESTLIFPKCLVGDGKQYGITDENNG